MIITWIHLRYLRLYCHFNTVKVFYLSSDCSDTQIINLFAKKSILLNFNSIFYNIYYYSRLIL